MSLRAMFNEIKEQWQRAGDPGELQTSQPLHHEVEQRGHVVRLRGRQGMKRSSDGVAIWTIEG